MAINGPLNHSHGYRPDSDVIGIYYTYYKYIVYILLSWCNAAHGCVGQQRYQVGHWNDFYHTSNPSDLSYNLYHSIGHPVINITQ